MSRMAPASSSSKTKSTSPRGSSSTSRPRATRSSSPPTAERALERLLAGAGGFDLVLLDLMLPGLSGFEVLRRVRAAGVLVPVLVLTAKDETPDRVRGLEEGADDYLTKPFHLDELLARVRGLLAAAPLGRRGGARGRRAAADRRTPRCTSTVSSSRRRRGGSASRRARWGSCARSPSARARRVTRGELLEAVWGLRPDTNTRVVDSFVVRLRRYVEPDPSRPRHIVSVRGHGYRLVR